MVPLPLFKLAALFVRHISKYGANRIKVQAHEHEGFRRFAARYGQSIHQLNMRLNVALLRNYDAEKRAREAAEAPTVKTKEQVDREEREKKKEAADRAKYGTTAREAHPVRMPDDGGTEKAGAAGTTGAAGAAGKSGKSGTSAGGGGGGAETGTTGSGSGTGKRGPVSVWRRRFRPLPEAKAVDLFADVVGDGFILIIASALVLYEYYRSASKPDANLERIKALNEQVATLHLTADADARALQDQESRILAMEAALRAYHDPKTKQPLLATPPPPPPLLLEQEEKDQTQARESAR